MESMREINRVMERERAKGNMPLCFEKIEFTKDSFYPIESEEKLREVLEYQLRLGTYQALAGKLVGNNVYMDLLGRKVIFKRTHSLVERKNIGLSIWRYMKKLKPEYEGKTYVETVRCFFTLPEQELEKCRFVADGKETYAFLMSNRYMLALYTLCLEARKNAGDIQAEDFTEVERGIISLQKVRDVLFQALLFDDVRCEDGKLFANLYTIYLLQ